MVSIVRKFGSTLIIGAITLTLPVIAISEPDICPENFKSPRSFDAGLALAHREMMPPPFVEMMPLPNFPNRSEFVPPFPPDLNLTEAQQDKIFEIMHKQAPLARAQHKAVHKIEEEINQLAVTDHYNQSDLRTLADKFAKAIADELVQRLATQAELRALLSPRQRAHEDEIRSQFKAHSDHAE